MDDNKNKRISGGYFYTSSNNTNSVNNVNDVYRVNTGNINNPTNKPNHSNPRMISQGRPNTNPVNYAGRGIPKVNRSSYKPLPSPKIDSKENDENNVNEEESNEQYREPRRRAVSDVAGKVKKVKDTISFFQKYKIVIICGCIAFAVIILFMFMMMVVKLDGDGGRDTSSGGYDEITMNTNGSGNEELWWPIGSSEVTTSIDIDGNTIEFRSGEPVKTYLSSPYGYRGTSFHDGIDIHATGNIYLVAMADGEITFITDNRDSGSYSTYPDELPDGTLVCSDHAGIIKIHIKYNNGFESRYLHLEEKSIPSYLKVGSKVYQGQVIGKMGNTGCSTGQHLHYSLLFNNKTVNPDNFVTSSNPRLLPDGVTKRSEDILKKTYSRVEDTDPDTGEVVVGKDNKQTVCLTLKNYGYNDTATAAIMVNMEKESGFNPKAVNPDGGASGICQWYDTRKTKLKSTYGSNWTSLSNQLEYFQNEITTSYKGVYNNLMGNGSTTDKTYYFCMHFEVPGESHCRNRINSGLPTKYETYVKNGCK